MTLRGGGARQHKKDQYGDKADEMRLLTCVKCSDAARRHRSRTQATGSVQMEEARETQKALRSSGRDSLRPAGRSSCPSESRVGSYLLQDIGRNVMTETSFPPFHLVSNSAANLPLPILLTPSSSSALSLPVSSVQPQHLPERLILLLEPDDLGLPLERPVEPGLVGRDGRGGVGRGGKTGERVGGREVAPLRGEVR